MRTPGQGDSDEQASAFRAAGPYLTLGIQLAATIVLLFFIGRYLDQRFATAPWLMIVGLTIGCVGGLIKFIRTVQTLANEEDQRAGKHH